eukprot:scpid95398/ scgid9053/ 
MVSRLALLALLLLVMGLANPTPLAAAVMDDDELETGDVPGDDMEILRRYQGVVFPPPPVPYLDRYAQLRARRPGDRRRTPPVNPFCAHALAQVARFCDDQTTKTWKAGDRCYLARKDRRLFCTLI